MLAENQSLLRNDEAPSFRRMFRPGRLSLGVCLPAAALERDAAALRDQAWLAMRAQALGFSALWLRDVLLRDARSEDIGALLDPWVHLGWIAAHTHTIALATTVVLPLRHPLHVAKAAASLDQLSGARLVLGTLAGDRPPEFLALGVDIEYRAALFRERFEFVRRVLETEFPIMKSSPGTLTGHTDLVPKPIARLPMLVSGNSGQSLAWIAEHADGWITVPRGIDRQAEAVARWQSHVFATAQRRFKPFVQSLVVDLDDDPQLPPTPIASGFKAGRHFLLRFLDALRAVGVNHVMLDIAHGARPAVEVLEEIGTAVVPALAGSQGDTPIGGELEPSDAETDDSLASQY
jgi:luciferase-type oxidoreductase